MQLLSSLQAIAEGKYQRSAEINFLVEKTYSLATSYIRLNHKKIFRLLQKGEYAISEIAVDAIAAMFIYDEEKKITPLVNSFNNWNPPVANESDALFFLNKVVAGRVEQHIFALLREYDPFFSKILDSINYLIKTGGYKKISSAGKSLIVENNVTVLCGDVINYEEFEKIPSKLLIDKKKLLPSVFNYLKNETNFTEAIPINLLVNRIKHIKFTDYISNYNDSVQADDIELSEFTDSGFNSASSKLELTYVKKGKLSKYEADCIQNALRDMSNDLLDGGISPGMYEYLTVYMKDLDKDQYLTNYHNIIEYLIKVMKNTIAEKITQEN